MDRQVAYDLMGASVLPGLRKAVLDGLLAAVNAVSRRGGLQIVEGAAGSGKSTLVELVAERFDRDGGSVLRADCSQSEADLPFAALHQLLLPISDRFDLLPPRQLAALQVAFGLAEDNEAQDPMLIGIAVLTLLSDLAVDQPVLAVVDDAHWADHSSLDALTFVARRVADEPVTILIVTHEQRPPGLAFRAPATHLGGVPVHAAGALLDLQPHVPVGRTRARIIEQAEGNPLALVELARAAEEHADSASVSDSPLPVTDRLERIYAARLAALPPPTRTAVVRLAVADAKDPPGVVLSWLPGIGDPVWTAAEQAGLIRRTGGRLRCAHPLSRNAIYHAAPPGERQEAHLQLANLFNGQDRDRYAWHLAAATAGSSASVSAELERNAGRARHRSGYAAAAHMLERAADLHPDPVDTTRLLAGATSTAVLTGRLDEVQRLAARTRASTEDPTVAALAAIEVGKLMTLTTSHDTAFGQLIRPAAALAATQPKAALEALVATAVVRFYSSDTAQLHEIERLALAGRMATAPGRRDGHELLLATWIDVVANPEGAPLDLPARLPALLGEATGRAERSILLGILAWMVDETDVAVRAFDAAVESSAIQEPLPDGLVGVGALAYLDHGRWAAAQRTCTELAAVAAVAGLDHAAACASATEALLRALRGDSAGARLGARRALALVDPLQSRSVVAIAQRALGAAASSEGDHQAAFTQYRALFDSDGDPMHYVLSYPALHELASSAARSGNTQEAAEVLEAVACSEGGAGLLGPRRSALVHLGRALLAPSDEAESHFTHALKSPALARRPLEQAHASLAYGEWLRRRRRIVEARPHLVAARDVFRRLGAKPATTRADAELRAAGAPASPLEPDVLDALTPQQQQIARLAARGMTNRQIAERLFLSPRTVSSHLYRAFPKLGVSVRSQLRDVVEASGVDTDFA